MAREFVNLVGVTSITELDTSTMNTRTIIFSFLVSCFFCD